MKNHYNHYEDEFYKAIKQLRIWKRQGKQAPHKPLLLLLALGRIQRNEPQLMSFTELEPKLISLLKSYSDSSPPYNAGYPFWRLKEDGLWEVRAPSNALIPRKSNTDPTLASLRKSGAIGGISAPYDSLLRSQPEVLRRAVRIILDSYFPTNLHKDLLAAVSLSLE